MRSLRYPHYLVAFYYRILKGKTRRLDWIERKILSITKFVFRVYAAEELFFDLVDNVHSLSPSNEDYIQDKAIEPNGVIMGMGDNMLKAAQVITIKPTTTAKPATTSVKPTTPAIVTTKPIVSVTPTSIPTSVSSLKLTPITSSVSSIKLTPITSSSLPTKVTSASSSSSSVSKASSSSSLLSVSKSSSASPTITPTSGPGTDYEPNEEYPTDIDMDLIMYCINDWEQPSCVEFFRFAHFFFMARVPNDPELADYLIELGIAPPDDDPFTRTSTSTFSVMSKLL